MAKFAPRRRTAPAGRSAREGRDVVDGFPRLMARRGQAEAWAGVAGDGGGFGLGHTVQLAGRSRAAIGRRGLGMSGNRHPRRGTARGPSSRRFDGGGGRGLRRPAGDVGGSDFTQPPQAVCLRQPADARHGVPQTPSAGADRSVRPINSRPRTGGGADDSLHRLARHQPEG